MNRLTCTLFAVLLGVGCGPTPGPLLTVTTSGTGKADGKTGTAIEVSVTKDGKPLNRGSYTATSSLEGSGWDRIEDSSGIPDPKTTGQFSSGPVSLRLYSVQKGEAVVNFVYTDDVSNKSDTKTVTIIFSSGPGAGVASFDFISAEPETIPFGESSVITFKAKDAQGAAVNKAQVSFRLSQEPGGASLSPTTGETSTDGTVTTTLTAGNTAGTVIVEAFVGEVKKPTPALNISGGGINAKNLSLVCPHYYIAGYEMFGLAMECTVYGSDYNHAFVPDSQVLFLSEAGGVPRSQKFSEDPNEGGAAVFTYRTQCKLPRDVLPNTGEDSAPGKVFDACQAQPDWVVRKDLNPRDGRATLVAITTGEEEYQDLDGNNTWDPGEPFTDLPEPFVDANDNKTRDADEDFHDANNNGKWDGPNKKWDRNTAIWTSRQIIWTAGLGNVTSFTGLEKLEILPTSSEPPYEDCTSVRYDIEILDSFGNPLTSASDQDQLVATCTGSCQVLSVTQYGTNGKASVLIQDNQCCTTPPCPPPAPFTVTFELQRTLVANANGNAPQKKQPLPERSGSFK